MAISGYTNNSAGHGAFIAVFSCKKSGMRTTISHRYAKALSTQRRLQGGTPHAYYLADGQVPGWVRVTFDLDPPGVEFRLNEWAEEEA